MAEFDVPPYERVTNVDTILALKSVTSALTTDVWNLFFFQFQNLTFNFIDFYQPSSESWLYWVYFLRPIMYIKLILASVLVFWNSDSKVGKNFRVWVFYINYLWIPLGVISVQLSFYILPYGASTNPWVLWTTVYSFTQIGSILSFYSMVRPRINFNKRKLVFIEEEKKCK